jgi:LytS/YehU family sensor histidine kinase
MYFVIPRYVSSGRYWWALCGVISLIFITALTSPLINNTIISPLREALHVPHKNTGMSIFHSFIGGLRGSLTVAGFATAIKLVKYWYLKKTDNEKLEKEKLKAELQILKGQLHPHFLFNTLNSIYAMSLAQPGQAPGAILKLSQLLRYILTEGGGHTVALVKEIQILNDYIALERSRFGNRLEMTVNIDGNPGNHIIAPLLLLPFIENSFKYGANEMLEQAWISIDVRIEHDTLGFKLINGKACTTIENPNSFHIGLQNVKKRLALLYPNAHDLRIMEDEDTFVVSLNLQLTKIKLPES